MAKNTGHGSRMRRLADGEVSMWVKPEGSPGMFLLRKATGGVVDATPRRKPSTRIGRWLTRLRRSSHQAGG